MSENGIGREGSTGRVKNGGNTTNKSVLIRLSMIAMILMMLAQGIALGESFVLDGTITWDTSVEEMMAWFGANSQSVYDGERTAAIGTCELFGKKGYAVVYFEGSAMASFMFFTVSVTDGIVTGQLRDALEAAFGEALPDDEAVFSIATTDKPGSLNGIAGWKLEDGTSILLWELEREDKAWNTDMVAMVNPAFAEALTALMSEE